MAVSQKVDLIEQNQGHFRTQCTRISLNPLTNPRRFSGCCKVLSVLLLSLLILIFYYYCSIPVNLRTCIECALQFIPAGFSKMKTAGCVTWLSGTGPEISAVDQVGMGLNFSPATALNLHLLARSAFLSSRWLGTEEAFLEDSVFF